MRVKLLFRWQDGLLPHTPESTGESPDEETSIGLILCAEKDHLDVQVALQDVNKPIGVAEYQDLLPKDQIFQIVSSELSKSAK